MPISQSLLHEFDEEMKNTRKILERVPDGKGDFRPHPKSMTLGRLSSHVAELPAWIQHSLESDGLDLQPGFQPYIAGSTAELLETFDKNASAARASIEAASDEAWQGTWTFKYAGRTMFSAPRTAVVRMTCLNHLIHHRAQLGVYLRMNEVAFPGMYGPSADDKNMFQPATA
jgi:uncharacterized damage-inducible protein DinB